jgi:hypothetical protein
MTRKLKPYEVDSIKNLETGVRVIIYLDRESKTFFGVLGDKSYEAKTAQECRLTLFEALKTYRPFVWEKIIEAHTVEVDHMNHEPPGGVAEDSHSVHFELHFRRYQRARSLAEKESYLERGFGVVEEDFDDVWRKKWTHNWTDSNSVILPYTDETWEKLCALKAGIEELNRRLNLLLDPKDGAKRLLELQVRNLLPAAPTPIKEKL